MSGETDIVVYHCEGPVDAVIDEARDLVYSDVSTLEAWLKGLHPQLSDDLCSRIVRNVLETFLKELDEKT